MWDCQFVKKATPRLRKYLWNDLNNNYLNLEDHWMAIGDFNSIICADETSKDRTLDQRRCANFTNWIFLDMGYSGPRFTWMRGTSIYSFKGAQLDQALCNLEWRCRFPQARVEILPKHNSEHSPVLVSLGVNSGPPTPRPFIFQTAWLTHPGFSRFIQAAWKNTIPLSENNKSVGPRIPRIEVLMITNQDIKLLMVYLR